MVYEEEHRNTQYRCKVITDYVFDNIEPAASVLC